MTALTALITGTLIIEEMTTLPSGKHSLVLGVV